MVVKSIVIITAVVHVISEQAHITAHATFQHEERHLTRSEMRRGAKHLELEATGVQKHVSMNESQALSDEDEPRFMRRGSPSSLPLEVSDEIGAYHTAQRDQSPTRTLLEKATAVLAGAVRASGAQPDYDYSHDWLYGYSTTVCGLSHWDNTQYSIASRAFLPILYAALVLSVVISGRLTGRLPESAQQETALRRYDLDYARILCIVCVIWDHSGGWQWTQHNIFFSQQWVLPYLYLVSGSSFILSRKALWMYVARLVAVFVVGVSANLVADQLTGRDWRGDFGNTIFQMFYVAMLILVSVITGPLRRALRSRISHQDGEADWCLWASVVIFGLFTGIGFAFFVSARVLPLISDSALTRYPQGMVDGINNTPLALIQVAGILLLCHLACIFKATDLLSWLLLLHIYLPRLVIPYASVGFVHNVELLIFAMVAQSWKIRGYQTIKKTVQGYWPLLIFFLLILSCADMQGRCDLVPANSIGERLRFYGIELAFCLCLCTGAFEVGDPYNTKATEWLNYWALCAYCFHVALHRLVPQPYGGVITYSSCILFYCWAKCKAEKPDAGNS